MKLTTTIEDAYKDVASNKIEVLSQTQESESVSKIINAYQAWYSERRSSWTRGVTYSSMENTVQFVNKYFENTFYTPKDITDFSFALHSFQNKENFFISGNFITALIKLHYQKTKYAKEYLVVTEHLEKGLDNLCANIDGENVRIQGNGGSYFGSGMLSGNVTVSGNVESAAGFDMKQGKMVVEGNAEDFIGGGMENGSITIKKNAGNHLGKEMNGGDILVEGNCGECAGNQMQSGSIEIYGNVEKDLGVFMGRDFTTGELKKRLIRFFDPQNMFSFSFRKKPTITVFGSAGDTIGSCMDNGKIMLYGSYGSISKSFISGKIYHNNKIIESGFRKKMRNVEFLFGSEYK